jgi:hypothetical protein
MTLAERLASLNNDPDVLEASIVSDAAPISGFNALYTADIRYAAIDGGRATDNRVRLVGIDHGGQNEAWYWLNSVPGVLTNTPVVFFDGHDSGPFTSAQIKTFCNTKWATVETSPAAIKQFSLERIDGLTVRASGLFHVPSDATNKWQTRAYIMRYTSAGQTPTAVLFERVAID